MSGYDDDEDWVGEPPEGRISRDRADPGYWSGVRLASVAGAAVGIGLIVLAIVLLS